MLSGVAGYQNYFFDIYHSFSKFHKKCNFELLYLTTDGSLIIYVLLSLLPESHLPLSSMFDENDDCPREHLCFKISD